MTGTGTVLFDDISVSSGTYSTCRSCHGEFIGKPYVAFTDGATWTPDLHDVHRFRMLNFDCNTCHTGNTFFPVFIGSSNGGTGLPGIGCLGCHGREADMGHDEISSGRAAGLNQHHHRTGVTECAKCHTDADPANYDTVGENVLPAYFFTPDAAHPDKPIAVAHRRALRQSARRLGQRRRPALRRRGSGLPERRVGPDPQHDWTRGLAGTPPRPRHLAAAHAGAKARLATFHSLGGRLARPASVAGLVPAGWWGASQLSKPCVSNIRRATRATGRPEGGPYTFRVAGGTAGDAMKRRAAMRALSSPEPACAS